VLVVDDAPERDDDPDDVLVVDDAQAAARATTANMDAAHPTARSMVVMMSLYCRVG